MATALIFPGQGSQKIGMGKELAAAFAEAKEVFEAVDEALSQPLSRLMFDGDAEELTLTENAQPALMAVSLAVLRVLQGQGGFAIEKRTSSYVAGHSLGEYSALAAADSISLEDTARLLKTRGQAMQAAVPVGQGSMAAIIGLDAEVVEELVEAVAAEGDVCEFANDNSPGQSVVSGSVAGVEKLMELAKEKGAKRCLPLPVSAPFHSSLMQPAAEVMAEALAKVKVAEPVVPLVANVTASTVTDPDEIRKLLVQQVTGRVRWTESVEFMTKKGVARFVELGSGKVLSGLVRRISPDAETMSVETPEDIETFLTKF